jgi:hypothetical protein
MKLNDKTMQLLLNFTMAVANPIVLSGSVVLYFVSIVSWFTVQQLAIDYVIIAESLICIYQLGSILAAVYAIWLVRWAHIHEYDDSDEDTIPLFFVIIGLITGYPVYIAALILGAMMYAVYRIYKFVIEYEPKRKFAELPEPALDPILSGMERDKLLTEKFKRERGWK